MAMIDAAEEEEALAIVRRRTPLLDRKPVRRALPWLVIVVFFGLWEAAVRLFAIPEFILPAPSAVFAAAWEFRVAILDNAKPPIDMIAIETHGRGGLTRMLLGSVADKVIRGSTLPILVHRPKS